MDLGVFLLIRDIAIWHKADVAIWTINYSTAKKAKYSSNGLQDVLGLQGLQHVNGLQGVQGVLLAD